MAEEQKENTVKTNYTSVAYSYDNFNSCMSVGFSVTEENLRSLFPGIEFPAIFTPEFVQSLGYGIYEWTQVPEVAYPNKRVEIAPTLRDNGNSRMSMT